MLLPLAPPFSAGKRPTSMGRGRLNKSIRKALEQARHLNPDINLHDYEVPAVVSGGEVQAMIYNNTESVQVVVRCVGCCRGKAHYRKCSPKALRRKGALHCRFCLVGAQPSVPPGVKKPHATEQQFMAVLQGLGMDEEFCYQVVPPFWHRCMDFHHYTAGYYVQVDGSCHWTDMFQQKCEGVLNADFRQAVAAVNQGGTVVRVHQHDLSSPSVAASTLAAAQGFVGVVLSPSYAQQWVPYQGQKLPYIQALLAHDPTLAPTHGTAGIVHIQKR